MEFEDFAHGHMAVATGPEPVRVVVKQPLEERAQEEANHLLGHPVADGGDPQRTRLALTLGDMDATQGEGFIRPILQTPHQGEQVVYEVALEGLDALPVNPRGPAIPPDVAEGEQQESQGDPSRQRMVLDLGHVEPFAVEPHETETLEAFGGQARGGCFLADPAGFGRGPSGLSRPAGANCPHGSGRVFLREHGTSFHPWAAGRLGGGYSGDAAIPEAASLWGETFAPPRDRTVSQCLWVRLTRLVPGRRGTFTGQCGRPLYPGEAASRLVGSQRRPVVDAARGSGDFHFLKASAGLGAWPTDPAETRPLPSHSCLAPPSPAVAGPLRGGDQEEAVPVEFPPGEMGPKTCSELRSFGAFCRIDEWH